MRRRFAALLPVLLALAACSSPDTRPGTTEGAPETTLGSTMADPAPGTTSGGTGEVTTTTAPPEATGTTSGRPVAPDFTLELGDGGSYTLSEGARPVYLVFWAEW